MDIETRVKNLEDMLASFAITMSNNKFYTDADIAGVKKEVKDTYPWEESKLVYIEDDEVIFENVPEGDLTVFVDGEQTTYIPVRDEHGNVLIKFVYPLEEVSTVTIKVV